MRILVVEDDNGLREAIVSILKEEKYVVDEASSGDEGLYLAKQDIYDLVILDIMLPAVSGLEIVRSIRNSKNMVPILLLTARDSIEDRVIGLNSGADDYLVKPFAIPEFLARIKALLRRKGSLVNDGELLWGNIRLDTKVKDAFIDNQPLGLTSKEYELFEFLILNCRQILSKEQIFDRVWGFESDTTIGIVDVYMHYLRKKLAAYNLGDLIQTVRGAGFILREKN